MLGLKKTPSIYLLLSDFRRHYTRNRSFFQTITPSCFSFVLGLLGRYGNINFVSTDWDTCNVGFLFFFFSSFFFFWGGGGLTSVLTHCGVWGVQKGVAHLPSGGSIPWVGRKHWFSSDTQLSLMAPRPLLSHTLCVNCLCCRAKLSKGLVCF